MESWVRLERRNGVVVLHLDRPRANAIDIAYCEQLEEVFGELAGDPEAPAVVITGTGDVFSAGLDLKALPGYSIEDQNRLINSLNRLLLLFYGFPRPVVGAINGHAIAAGMVLLLASDYRVGTEHVDARFGLTEAQVGVPFPVGAKEIVMTELSLPTARRMMLTGGTWGSEKMLSDGAIDELVEPERVLPRAVEVAVKMASLPADSYARIKEQVRGEALAKMRIAAREENDPILGSWMTPESARSASGIIAKG